MEINQNLPELRHAPCQRQRPRARPRRGSGGRCRWGWIGRSLRRRSGAGSRSWYRTLWTRCKHFHQIELTWTMLNASQLRLDLMFPTWGRRWSAGTFPCMPLWWCHGRVVAKVPEEKISEFPFLLHYISVYILKWRLGTGVAEWPSPKKVLITCN